MKDEKKHGRVVIVIAVMIACIVVGMKIERSMLENRPDRISWQPFTVTIQPETKTKTSSSRRDTTAAADSIARARIAAIDSTNEHAKADSIVRAQLVRKSGKFTTQIPDTIKHEVDHGDTTVAVFLPLTYALGFDGDAEKFSMTTVFGQGTVRFKEKHVTHTEVLGRGLFQRLIEDLDLEAFFFLVGSLTGILVMMKHS